jgi:hypothetical protein
MPYSVSLGEVFDAHSDTLKDELRNCLPATVTSVNPVLQTVDVVVGVQNPIFSEDGAVSYEVLPALSSVPLACLSGGGFFIWLPVKPGDTVLLVFSDLSLDTWMAGDGSIATKPGWVGKHTMDSPVAFPVLRPALKALASPVTDPTKLIIGKDGSQAQIKIGASDIELGAVTTDFVALASVVDSFAAVFAAWAPTGVVGDASALKALLTTWASTHPTSASPLVKTG